MKGKIIPLFLIISLAFLLPITVNAYAEQDTYKKIDQYVKQSIDRAHIPGMSILIVNKDEVLFSNTYGNCSSINTPFIIGSMSKSFTAVSIMQLIEQGKVSLDSNISNYLTDCSIGDKITVRQLLNQTSGLGEHQRLSNIKITSSYGTHQYASVNYSLLGEIIERVSGMSYDEYVTEHIFKPLSMDHSAASLNKSMQSGLISGYRNFFGFPIAGAPDYPNKNSWSQVPAGYISSSASDMGKYLQMYLKGGEKVITEESINTVFYSNVLVDASTSYYYGMGWSLTKKYKEPILGHSGLVENYMSNMYILPDSNIGVVILANTNDYLVAGNMFDAMSDSVPLMLLGYSPIEISDSKYLSSHLMLDFVYVTLFLIALFPIFRLKRFKGKLTAYKTSRIMVPIIILHAVYPTILLLLPGFLDSPLWILRYYVPDLFITL
ncbi:MAG TPA: serine hydrolase domain-containing protein, partial [Clostridia bacterium]|nr:serine hydrolase domain-containing protein [Clostridia bacterium]